MELLDVLYIKCEGCICCRLKYVGVRYDTDVITSLILTLCLRFVCVVSISWIYKTFSSCSSDKFKDEDQ